MHSIDELSILHLPRMICIQTIEHRLCVKENSSYEPPIGSLPAEYYGIRSAECYRFYLHHASKRADCKSPLIIEYLVVAGQNEDH